MVSWPEPPELRRCALAVAVLHDVDILPATDGVVLPGKPDVHIRWAECRRALAGTPVDTDAGRARLARWLLLRRAVADRPLELLERLARPWGSPVDSPLHPGLDWVRRRVLGDALDLGFAFVGLDPANPERPVPVPAPLLASAKIDPTPWWSTAVVYLERMGEMALDRLQRSQQSPLRPMGDCDVVTLLGSMTLRAGIAGGDAQGMRTVAVPMRNRGWLDLSRVDPAFSAAAARLTDIHERGFERPLLVTRDEVVQAREGGDVLRAAKEAARRGDVVDVRDVLYHRFTIT
jgi:hypothetical protein